MFSLFMAQSRRNIVTSTDWSQAHEVRDFERWLPAAHQERLRSWVEASSSVERRAIWQAVHDLGLTDSEAASALLELGGVQ